MTNSTPSMIEIAERVRTALATADLDACGELLDANVRWALPMTLHRRVALGRTSSPGTGAQARGRRADVHEVTVHGRHIVVAMSVLPDASSTSGAAQERWQILTVANGRIADIRGFASREDAVARLG